MTGGILPKGHLIKNASAARALEQNGGVVWPGDRSLFLAIDTGWAKYVGPHGGHGWRNTATGEIVYQEQAPGQTIGHEVDPQTAFQSLRERIASLPAKAKQRVAKGVQFIHGKYAKLEEHFGRAGAVGVIGAAALASLVPMPGTSLVPIILAEAYIRLKEEKAAKAGVQMAMEILLAAVHAPAGYTRQHPLQIGGKSFVGGEFIPGNVLAKATPEEKQQLKRGPQKSGKQKQPAQNMNAGSGVRIAPVQPGTRAFAGKTIPMKTQLGKQEAGKLGEEIAIAWLHANGLTDARHMNLDRNNFPIDLIQDTKIIEAKTGLASNGQTAQQWRLTIGEPGKAEKEWLTKASAEEKAAWNERKQQKIVDRKKKVMSDLQKKLGYKVGAQTITVILNPDAKLADIYVFDGWHNRIGWNSAEAKAGYKATVQYA